MVEPLKLPGLQTAAASVCAQLQQGEPRVTLYGRASSGKSSTMALIGDQLRSQGWSVYPTQMTHDDDGGPVALATLAALVAPPARDQVLDLDRPWHLKVDLLIDHLTPPDGQRAVILLDDPWIPPAFASPSMFAERSLDLLDRLERAPRLCVVRSMTDRPSRGQLVELPAAAEPRAVLAPQRWEGSALAETAAMLLASGHPALARLTPVELRLAVALVSAGRPLDEALRLASSGPRALPRAAIESMGSATLRGAIARMGVMRTPFDDATFDVLAAGLGAQERALVEQAILFRTDEGLVLPELLTGQLREYRDSVVNAEQQSAHRVAARFHERQFDIARARRDVPAATRHEMEIIHHLTAAGDAEAVLSRSVHFVEQYDALGKSLSVRGLRSGDEASLGLAVQAYERAIEHDPGDAYAHHYRAYNLDILARDASAAEAGYRRALDLQRDHPWHHCRLITFLLTRSRVREAQSAWDGALRQLDGVRRHAWLFRELHRPVARLLLHRGRLEFARLVLEDVPASLDLDWRDALLGLLVQLEEAQADSLVFPAHIAHADRWSGPHLLLSPDERVLDWRPGRIEHANGEVVIRYQEQDGRLGRRTFSAPDFRTACATARKTMPAAGTFVELIRFEGEADDEIRCYPISQISRALPQPFPPPDRYLRP